MKKTFLGLFSLLVSTSILTIAGAEQVKAEESKLGSDATVRFTGEYPKTPTDPENPGVIVDPGPSPSTDGKLRIEFVPTLQFGQQQMSKTDTVCPAFAQLFHSDTNARGNYVQVSDYRATKEGWVLQLRQETQFKNDQTLYNELTGAVLSFDKSWANSLMGAEQAPTVAKDIIKIDNIGDTYNLAQADQGKGEGTWTIEFGASSENQAGQGNTLSPLVDGEGQPIMDATFQKPIYQNSAITLTVPGATKKDPVAYQTVLTWILAELP